MNYINKFDKKNKGSIKQEDILDIKKKKNKLQKKNRKNLQLDSEELFLNNKSNIILNEDNLSPDLIKAPKLSKNRKKSKIKQEIIYQSNDSSNLSNLSSNTKEITINSPLTIQELSYKLSIPEAEIITYLFLKGISVTINQVVDISIASDVAVHYKFSILSDDSLVNSKFSFQQEDTSSLGQKFFKRPPIITILGHVDHGKTTLLDTILKTNLVKEETGGITQSITSYEIDYLYDSNLYKLIFLDTPGHEAFASMRIRGTQVTDIILLVVAADDGLKPQTIESIKYIREKNLTYIVVINKIDKPGANIMKVREELAEHNIVDEKWGGDATIIEISALKKQNIDLLLSNLCLLSDIQDLKANPNQLATGIILESYLDQQKGPLATLVVQNGTMKIGDFIIAGNLYGKIKVMFNNNNNNIIQAEPSSIIQILGFSSIPHAGTSFQVVSDKKIIKQYTNNKVTSKIIDSSLNTLNNRVTLDSYNINFTLKKVNLILKTDTQGSSEAIISAFKQISQEKVQINILSISSGNISNTDLELAIASNSLILGFNVNIASSIRNSAKQFSITLHSFNIIYDLLNYVTKCMLDLVDPEYDKLMIGKAVVQTVFSINKGAVAGCLVSTGKLRKDSHLSVYRNNEIIYDGILHSLKRMKDDVNEVLEGSECGVMSYDYSLWEKGDIVEVYELHEKNKIL
uniref:Translation initiation factor IF-2, chloroplastic n=1 Tax=Antithamnion hubbsii TaxID=1005974 RepID=A0A4D6WLM3_9FLOR|nr:Translation initiation factor 2 [Antithamnion hubbsii]